MDTKERLNFISLLKEAALWLGCRWDRILTVLLTLCMAAGALWYTHRAIGEREISSGRTSWGSQSNI